MNIKKISFAVLCLMLAFALFVIPSSSILAATTSDYDYSRAGSYFNTTLTSADILELAGYELSDGERAYLDEYGSLNVSYETVTTQQVSVITVDGTTRVSAKTYSYLGANGTTVTWTPIAATLEGETKQLVLNGDSYIADFDGAAVTDTSAVSVRYDMNTVTVCADDINAVLNLAYSDAVSLKNEMALYTENAEIISEYFTSLGLYEKYVSDKLIFDQKKAEYSEYLEDVKEYEKKLKEYEVYLGELAEYTDQHEKVQSYDAAFKKYEAELDKYNKYLSDLQHAERQLKMLNDGLMNTVTYLDRQLYGCFFANLVDRVVANKDKFTLIGASAEDIEAANLASKNIRAILKPDDAPHYVNLKTTEEKYEFYVNNYAALRDNLIILTRALYNTYSIANVRNMMHVIPTMPGYTDEEDYTERFVIFISQLICFSNALSESPITDYKGNVLDYNVKFDYWKQDGTQVKGRTILEILENEIFVEDIDCPAPLSLIQVNEPTHPGERPYDPAPPTVVLKPVQPQEVKDPGEAPAVVQMPERPASAPEDESRLDILENEIYLDLISELDVGVLGGDREELIADFSFTPTATVSKALNVSDMVEVTFRDTDGAVIHSIGVEQGSAVNFTDALPTKAEDVSAVYVFDHWMDESGEPYDLSSVLEDVTLYPSFRPVYKEYPTETVDGTHYLFVDHSGNELEYVPMAHFIDVASADRLGIILKADNVMLTLPYSAVTELRAQCTESLLISVNTESLKSYSCRVNVSSADGGAVSAFGISVSIPCSDALFATASVLSYTDSDGLVKEVSKTYKDGNIVIRNLNADTTYSFKLEYALSNNSNLNGKVTYPTVATPGDTVELVVNIPLGTVAEFYYAVYPDLSTKYKIEGNSFVMPYGDVRLSANFTELQYTVKFVSEGKVISEKNDYKYGDTVRVPNNPTKTSDGKYSYAFVGWSPDISVVTGDITYVAEFEATLLPPVEEKVSLIVVIVYVCIGLFALGVPTIIVFILDRKKIINVKGVLKTVFGKLTRGRGKPSLEKQDFTEKNDSETDEK